MSFNKSFLRLPVIPCHLLLDTGIIFDARLRAFLVLNVKYGSLSCPFSSIDLDVGVISRAITKFSSSCNDSISPSSLN